MCRFTGSPGGISKSAGSMMRGVASSCITAVRKLATGKSAGSPCGFKTSGEVCPGGLIGEGELLEVALSDGTSSAPADVSGSIVAPRDERGVPTGVLRNIAERQYCLALSGTPNIPEARHCSSRSSNNAPDVINEHGGLTDCACAGGLSVVCCDDGLEDCLEDPFTPRFRSALGRRVPMAVSALATVIALQYSESCSGNTAGSMPDCSVCPGACCHMTTSWSHERIKTVNSCMPNSCTLPSWPMDAATCFQKAGTAEVSATSCSAPARAEAATLLRSAASINSSALSLSCSSSETLPWAGLVTPASSASPGPASATRRATSL
mmetsp:Transcript_45962/g.133161  ORF Transcript_45962/g.133161 Transcript_45962/m.133161 type:complete len:322 (-) Transcript_45962:129-1094(-)